MEYEIQRLRIILGKVRTGLISAYSQEIAKMAEYNEQAGFLDKVQGDRVFMNGDGTIVPIEKL